MAVCLWLCIFWFWSIIKWGLRSLWSYSMIKFSFKIKHINIIMYSLYCIRFVRIISMIVYIIWMLIQKSWDSMPVPLPDKMVLYNDSAWFFLRFRILMGSIWYIIQYWITQELWSIQMVPEGISWQLCARQKETGQFSPPPRHGMKREEVQLSSACCSVVKKLEYVTGKKKDSNPICGLHHSVS